MHKPDAIDLDQLVAVTGGVLPGGCTNPPPFNPPRDFPPYGEPTPLDVALDDFTRKQGARP